MNVSPTLAMNNLMKKRETEGLPIYKLGFGQSPFPVPSIMVEELKNNAHVKDYLHTQGLDILREQISLYYKTRFSVNSDADQIIVGPGSKELIFLAQLTIGKSLFLPRPSWVSYEPQAKLLGLETHWIPTHPQDDWKLTDKGLTDFLSNYPKGTFTTILNYPNNPTGAIYTTEELERLTRIFREHEVIVISDEIYGEFTFDRDHISLGSIYPEGTIVCSGLSKWCGAGGWRLGYMIFPNELNKIKIAVIEAGSETYSCAAAPVQFAAIKAFQLGHQIKEYTNRCKHILQTAHRLFLEGLNPQKIKMVSAKGGFYSLLQFNPEAFSFESSESLCTALLEQTGVGVLRGSAFGMPPTSLCARMAFVDFDGTALLKEEDITKNHFPKLNQAIELMNNF